MMRTRKVIGFISFIMMMILLVTACSGKKDTMDIYNTKSSSDGYYPRDNTVQYSLGNDLSVPETAADMDYDNMDSSQEAPSSSYTLTSGAILQPVDKIIRTFFLEVETKEFDSLITTIDSRIKELGGYVENSGITGAPYAYSSTTRRGSITARIPSDRVDEFVNTVGDNANIITKNENSKNVSLEYIDLESRVEALEIEQERLFEILKEEVSVDNIITLQSRLSDIRYELQNYESQLRFYDNQVTYSTVNMNITEVEILTPVTETKLTMGTRIQNGFQRTMKNISEGLQNFCVWFVVNLPYLLIWAIIIAVITIIIKRAIKKSNAKKPTPPPMMYPGPQYIPPNQPGQNMLNPDQTQQNNIDQSQQK